MECPGALLLGRASYWSSYRRRERQGTGRWGRTSKSLQDLRRASAFRLLNLFIISNR